MCQRWGALGGRSSALSTLCFLDSTLDLVACSAGWKGGHSTLILCSRWTLPKRHGLIKVVPMQLSNCRGRKKGNHYKSDHKPLWSRETSLSTPVLSHCCRAL